jgi:hypothetical protein
MCYYLGSYQRLFSNVKLANSSSFSSNNIMLLKWRTQITMCIAIFEL